MSGMKYVGELKAVPDGMLADLLRNPSESSLVLDDKFQADVPAIVVEELGKAPTVEAAAASAVGAQLAAADVVIGTDKRVLPVPTKTGWYTLPESTGFLNAFVVVEQRDWYVLGGFLLDGSWSARTAGDTGAAAVSRTAIPDALIEWWVGKPQLNDDTVSVGAMGAKGAQLAADFNERTGTTATQTAVVPADDHNVGALCLVPRRGIIQAWTWHNADNLLRMVVAGGNGLGSTLRGKQEYTFPMGGTASYAQPWLLGTRRSGTTDTFWILVRVALRWVIREVVVDWATGVPTSTVATMPLIEFPEQAYIDTFPVAYENGFVKKIGLVAGFNPAASRDDVYLLELDLTTGIMHDKGDPARTPFTVTPNGTPLQSSNLTSILPNKTTGTRRLFGMYTVPGSEVWKILTCEYTGDVDPSGVITENSYNVSTYALGTPRTFGAAGRHLERYPAGACFGADGKVWHINEANNIFTLSQEGVQVVRTTDALFRVMACPAGAPWDVLFTRGINYGSYQAWSGGQLVAIKKGA